MYIMTDDQDVELGGLTPMPKTRRLLGDQGAVGEAMYVATPICCPSRTETLSGRLYHNVLSDDLSGCMHVNHTRYIFDHSSSLFPALQTAGYMTGGFGKIINGQGKIFNQERPLVGGWDWLSVPLDEGDYFGPNHFEKRPNGTSWVSSLGKSSEVVDSWYQTSQIGNRSLEFIAAALRMRRSFAAYLGPHAPHFAADAPPWARQQFADLRAPRTPAWNVTEGQLDKTVHVAQNPPLTATMVEYIDIHFRDRWRSIAGVDDMVALIHEQLEQWEVLNSTFIVFSSDHGYKVRPRPLSCARRRSFASRPLTVPESHEQIIPSTQRTHMRTQRSDLTVDGLQHPLSPMIVSTVCLPLSLASGGWAAQKNTRTRPMSTSPSSCAARVLCRARA